MPAVKDRCDVLLWGERLREDLGAAWADEYRFRSHVRFVKQLRTNRRPSPGGMYVVSYLDEWNEDLWSRLKDAHLQRILLLCEKQPIQSFFWHWQRLGIRGKNRCHIAPVESKDDVRALLGRMFESLGEQDASAILDAWWEGDTFVVLSPAYKRLGVPLAELPLELQSATEKERDTFELDEYGEFIYWPDHDIHMGWSQFEQAVNPGARLRAQQESDEFNKRYGGAIKAFREQHEPKLNQKDIDGLTDRTLRRIENGETRATSQAIAKLAKAHGMTPAEYMSELAEMLEAG